MYFFVAGKSTKKVRRGLASPLGGEAPLQYSRTSKGKRQIYLSRDLVRLTAKLSNQTKAAVSRCNFRGQAREKGKFIFRGITAYLIAINSSRQTRADVLNTKKKKAAKYRTNEVSGMLCGKTLFFPRFF